MNSTPIHSTILWLWTQHCYVALYYHYELNTDTQQYIITMNSTLIGNTKLSLWTRHWYIALYYHYELNTDMQHYIVTMNLTLMGIVVELHYIVTKISRLILADLPLDIKLAYIYIIWPTINSFWVHCPLSIKPE